MGDLISRSALIEEIESLTMQITGIRSGKGVLSECMKEYKKSILRIIEEQPTAYDVEKVVEQLEEELQLAEKEEKRCLIEHSQRYERAEQYALGISNA